MQACYDNDCMCHGRLSWARPAIPSLPLSKSSKGSTLPGWASSIISPALVLPGITSSACVVATGTGYLLYYPAIGIAREPIKSFHGETFLRATLFDGLFWSISGEDLTFSYIWSREGQTKPRFVESYQNRGLESSSESRFEISSGGVVEALQDDSDFDSSPLQARLGVDCATSVTNCYKGICIANFLCGHEKAVHIWQVGTPV